MKIILGKILCLSTQGLLLYEKCRETISIKKCNQIDTNDCRDIGDNVFIGSNTLVDIKYGVHL